MVTVKSPKPLTQSPAHGSNLGCHRDQWFNISKGSWDSSAAGGFERHADMGMDAVLNVHHNDISAEKLK